MGGVGVTVFVAAAMRFNTDVTGHSSGGPTQVDMKLPIST